MSHYKVSTAAQKCTGAAGQEMDTVRNPANRINYEELGNPAPTVR